MKLESLAIEFPLLPLVDIQLGHVLLVCIREKNRNWKMYERVNVVPFTIDHVVFLKNILFYLTGLRQRSQN